MVSGHPEWRLTPLPHAAVTLGPGPAQQRRALTASYVHSLKPGNLLQNHLLEAGRWAPPEQPKDAHWGWESPTSQVRGHFLGHWMSAAAHLAAQGDHLADGTLRHVVAELAACQRENGDGWVASIPEKYLHRVRDGKPVWAPTYVVHKTLLGLWDAYAVGGVADALDVLVEAAGWFTRFTDGMSRDALDDFLDWEAGGILEVWADLYGVTGAQEHLDLVERFDRRRLFDRLVAGEDPLTNFHANTTIPEILGAARAYEVTGDKRWKDAVEAYWRCAVTDRGTFATGGQTYGELWTPPYEFAARLGETNQEHCVVYNMCRLAERLLRWTGEAAYADYLDRNRWNGLYAQQNPVTGMVTYYLPLHAGGRKTWTTPTESFPCCLGTVVQAGTSHERGVHYTDPDGLVLAQYVSSTARATYGGTEVTLDVTTSDHPQLWGPQRLDVTVPAHRPDHVEATVAVRAATPVEFDLRLRLPWWLAGPPRVTVDGEPVDVPFAPGTFQSVRRVWQDSTVRVELPREVRREPLPDQPGTVAFVDGPVVLAGLVSGPRSLPAGVTFEPVEEREWGVWQRRYLADRVRFVPLHDVVDESYAVYFPLDPIA